MNTTSYGKKADLDLKLWGSLNTCFQTVKRKVEILINENGLTLAQFAVLELLYHQGNHSISGIMHKLLSTPGNMTVIIDNLLQLNLIRKNKDPNDKRVNLISLTKKGGNILKSILPSHILNIQTAFTELDPREKSALIDLSQKLEKSIRE